MATRYWIRCPKCNSTDNRVRYDEAKDVLHVHCNECEHKFDHETYDNQTKRIEAEAKAREAAGGNNSGHELDD